MNWWVSEAELNKIKLVGNSLKRTDFAQSISTFHFLKPIDWKFRGILGAKYLIWTLVNQRENGK